MLKISLALEELILDQPFLEEALANGFLNHSAFAEYIRPQVEAMTKKPITIASLKMALSRITVTNKHRKTPKFSARNFFLRKNIHLITLTKSPKSDAFINTIYELAAGFSDEYLVIIKGIHEIDIVFGDALATGILKILDHQSIQLHLPDCSIIGISLNDTMLRQPGVFYTVAKKLYFRNINILQIISTYHELGIVLKNDDAKKAFDVLAM